MGELELALDLLADAKLLLENARHRSAVSRSYYAAYHACIALLESLGLKPGNFIGRDRRPPLKAGSAGVSPAGANEEDVSFSSKGASSESSLRAALDAGETPALPVNTAARRWEHGIVIRQVTGNRSLTAVLSSGLATPLTCIYSF